jgi:DNA-binding NtrC family response regulator
MMTRSILVVDDEPNMRWVLTQALEQAGYSVQSADSGDAALGVVSRAPVDLVVLDLKLKSEDGLTILRRLRERRPELVVIILTAYGTVANAVEAMQLGAADMLRKPFDVEEVRFKIERALERRAMQDEIVRLQQGRRNSLAFEQLVGCSLPWLQTVERARTLATTDAPLLLWGEGGSGRRTLAQSIHAASTRQVAPFRTLDLRVFTSATQGAALWGTRGDDGAWAEAGSGTLVILYPEAAPQTLPLLEARLQEQTAPLGPRVLVVTDGEETVPEGLRARLPLRLRVPPLRERPGDALLLAKHLLGATALTPQAAQLIGSYTWPGDVTHLPPTLGDTAHIDGLPTVRLPQAGLNLDDVEQSLIRQALERARGNKSRAAELLGLTRHTLVYRMEKYGISVPERS